MSWPRRLRGRVLSLAMISGLLGTLLAVAAARVGVHRVVHKGEARELIDIAERERAACEADPERWFAETRGGARVFAYHAADRRSQNPAAPRYRGPAELPPRQVELDRGLPFGASWLWLRADSSGPCAYLQIHHPSRSEGSVVLAIGAATVLLAPLLAACIAYFTLLRPLLLSTAKVGRAAAQVGEARYRSPDKLESDELRAIAAAMDEAHRRIVSTERELRQHMRALERHLAEVAHDFRTPLTALQLCVEEALQSSDDPAVAGPLATALQETIYLSSLSENLRLQAKRREFGRFGERLEVVDLGELLRRLVVRAGRLARLKDIELRVALAREPMLVTGADLAIERALSNLVENAVVHGRAGSKLSLTCTREDDRFALVVAGAAGDDPLRRPSVAAAAMLERSGLGLGRRITEQVCADLGWQLISRASSTGHRVEIRGRLGAPPGGCDDSA